jgi:uncharacterized protein (DUF1684 family)
MVWAFSVLKLVGNVGDVDGWTTVVVTEWVVVLPLATANAIAPPAMAPPTMGSRRLRRFMTWFLLARQDDDFGVPSTAGGYEKPVRTRQEARKNGAQIERSERALRVSV